MSARHRDIVNEAFTGDGGWSTDGWVGQGVSTNPAGSPTALVYVREWQSGPRFENDYATIRIPLDARDASSGNLFNKWRLIVAETDITANVLLAGAWRYRTSDSNYAYYDVQVPNVPAGAKLRAERLNNFGLANVRVNANNADCLLYTSPSPRD